MEIFGKFGVGKNAQSMNLPLSNIPIVSDINSLERVIFERSFMHSRRRRDIGLVWFDLCH